MKRICLFLLAVIFSSAGAKAQVSKTVVIPVATLPATCTVGGPLYQKTSATTGLYMCTAANTLTLVGPTVTSGFLATTGATTGATAQRQAFTQGILLGDGIVTPTLRVADALGNFINMQALGTVDGSLVRIAVLDYGLLSTTRTYSFPNASGTFTLGGNTFTGTGSVVRATDPTISSLTFNSSSGIIGSTTNDAAAAGSVGEVLSATVATGSSVSLSTGTAATVTSVSLTAGDWDCSGVMDYTFGATTSYTALQQGINTTTNALGAQDSFTSIVVAANVPGSAIDSALSVPIVRESLAGTTTVYLVSKSTFSVSTLKAYGTIFCRRVR